MKRTLILIAAALLAGCQDHHFIPYEKADKSELPQPAQQDDNANAPAFATKDQTEEKYVMTDEYQNKTAATPAGELIATGTINLGDDFDHQDFGGYVAYLIAWDPDNPRMPVAVEKYDAYEFPITFRLDEGSLMAADFPQPGTELKLEVRMDGDGDVISKEKGDLYGFSSGLVPLGSKGVNLTLDRQRN